MVKPGQIVADDARMPPNWPVPTGPPIVTKDGVVPAPTLAPEQGEPLVEQPREARAASRLTAVAVGLAVSFLPLYFTALLLERSNSGVAFRTGQLVGGYLGIVLISLLLSVPCFFMATPRAWAVSARWVRSAIAFPAAVLTAATVTGVSLSVYSAAASSQWSEPVYNVIDGVGDGPGGIVGVAVLFGFPVAASALVVVDLTEVFTLGRLRSRSTAR